MAGVSTGTVDRVIHNRGEVSTKTKKKVLEVIQQLNYTPNLVASALSLSSKKNKFIAVLLPEPSGRNNYWHYPIQGVQQAAIEIANFGVTVGYYSFNPSDKSSFIRQVKSILANNEISGMVSAPFYPNELNKLINQLNLDIPIVIIDSELRVNRCSYIGQNSRQSGKAAAKLAHLFASKHENIHVHIVKFISQSDFAPIIEERMEGILEYFNQHLTGAPCKIHDIKLEKLQYDKSVLNIDLNADGAFPVFIVPNSKSYILAQYLQSGHVEDFVLIGYDLIEENARLLKNGSIDALICQQPEKQGYQAIKLIFDQIINKNLVTIKKYLPIDILIAENIDNYVD